MGFAGTGRDETGVMTNIDNFCFFGGVIVNLFIGAGCQKYTERIDNRQKMFEIASLTNGKYFRAKDIEALGNIYKELELLEPVEYEEESYVPKTLLYYYPLGLALILGFMAVFINTILQIIKRFRNGQ